MAKSNSNTRTVNYNINHKRSYGLLNFIFDLFMVCITAGLWLIWIFVREMRR